MRDGLPCAWGAIKALGAFAEVPEEGRSGAIQAAVKAGVSFLLDGDLATGGYPAATGSSRAFVHFGLSIAQLLVM